VVNKRARVNQVILPFDLNAAPLINSASILSQHLPRISFSLPFHGSKLNIFFTFFCLSISSSDLELALHIARREGSQLPSLDG